MRGVGLDCAASRGDAVENSVQLVVLGHGGLVEPGDECAAVVSRRQDAVVLELNHGLLDRDAAQPEVTDNLVAVDAVPGPQLARHHQIDDVGDNLILLLDPVVFGHPC